MVSSFKTKVGVVRHSQADVWIFDAHLALAAVKSFVA